MGKTIRICVMNNLLPSDIKYHEKYDLKGSMYKRQASLKERTKNSPTLKDLDFLKEHPGVRFSRFFRHCSSPTFSIDCFPQSSSSP